MPSKPKTVTPPKADKVEHSMKLHGDVRVDPYFWMRERDSEKVLKYIQEENDYAKAHLAASKPIAETLFQEMKARIKEDDSSAPSKKGEYFYYTRYEKGKEYAIYCRKKGSLDAPEEILLDVNELAKGKKYYSAMVSDVSTNHEMLAFIVDDVGRRFYTIHFKNLKTGKILTQKIPNTTGNWTWANDNNTGFYSQQHPETLRAEKIFRYDLSQDQSQEVYYEKDEIFNVGVGKSLNGKTIFIETSSVNSSEYLYVSADKPTDALKVFLKREKNHEYDVEDGGDGFYIRTNWQAENFRVMKTAYDKTAKKNWKDVVSHRKTVYLQSFAIFESFLATDVREKGLTQIEIRNRKDKKKKLISFQDPVYMAGIGLNEEYNTDKLRYTYSSLVQPDAIYDFDIKKQKSTLVKQKEVPTYDAQKYMSERAWAKAKDGARIPISIVYRKDLFKKSQNPILIYGYGSYGISMEAQFRPNIISLLDRGFVYAIAHIRGGQELGRDWFEKGRLMNKKNTFTDFVDSTEFLIKQGYGKSGRVYMQGGSAGGLLMGAVMNLRPDLYRGVHAAVPFVDVLTTMLDASIPLTTGEYEQWGNPNEKKAYQYIKSYSPYDNISDQKYPNLLITTGYHDSQVQYWEPLKWAAKLRDHNKADTLILMKTEMGAGHSGVTGRFSRTREIADEYGFFVWLESL
ncbi:S9 family peptidase [bacterium]|nr:S9 family peptidase [bacterium]